MLELFFTTFVIVGVIDSVDGDQVQVELSERQSDEMAIVTMELSTFPSECILLEGDHFFIVKETPLSLPFIQCETYSSCGEERNELP